MKKKLLVLSAIFSIVLVLSACGANDVDEAILGKWQDNMMGIISFDFQENGEVVVEGASQTETLNFSTSGDTLTLQKDEEKQDYTYTIKDNELLLNDGSQTLTLVKVEE